MSQAAEGKQDQPSMLERAEEIQQQIQHISGRDWQLWSIGILIMLVVTAGLAALILPNMVWSQRVMHIELSYLPQLFFGLISLILLINIYLLGQKFTLNTTRRALIRELVLNERLESLSLIDPLTQLLNRRAMNEFIPREVARANRLGAGLTFLTIDVDKFRSINTKFGSLEGDMLLTDFGKMLKLIFRGGDMVFRQGGDEFLILMPDTTEDQADNPLQRLLRMVAEWNQNNKKDYELSFSWGVAAYVTGTGVDEVLRAVDRKMYQKKNNLTPTF